MQESIPQVYDRNMKRLAFLQNAMHVKYELKINPLHTAGFSLPAEDPKNEYCKPMNFVEIFDGARRIELFRIIGEDLSRSTTAYTVYECEFVLATLLNDVLFKYHQIGGLGIPTTRVLRYILDRQRKPYWQLGRCDFSRQFEYKWENQTLLAALLSVPNAFDEPFMWTFDTTATPWRINLVKRDTTVKNEIRYQKNMQEIRRTKDSSTIITRIYPLGYGEGDNQLDITSINGGLPYIDADTVPEHGLIEAVMIDRRYESTETLLAYAKAMLEQLKNPYISYQVKAADLARFSPGIYEHFNLGDTIRIIDKRDGITVDAPIVQIKKQDVRGKPQDIEIVLANKTRSIASSIADLQNRQLINDAYAQGATNQMAINFADNCDPTHPAVLNLYVPDTMARINKCVLHYELEPFRGYTKGVASAPGSVQSSSAGGASTQSSSAGGGNTQTSAYANVDGIEVVVSGAIARRNTESPIAITVQPSGHHNHGLSDGVGLRKADDGITWFYPSGNHQHSAWEEDHHHVGRLQNTSHSHTVNTSDHTHTVTTQNHTHTVPIPEHGHEIEHGIYEGDIASTISLRVDGRPVSVTEAGEIDIIKHLSTDQSGRVLRNTWHKIEIIPDKMTRIIANVFFQIFTNSRGGGDY